MSFKFKEWGNSTFIKLKIGGAVIVVLKNIQQNQGNYLTIIIITHNKFSGSLKNLTADNI